MLTKQEMEYIWNNEPVGYLKNLFKKGRKLKKYNVIYRYKKTTYSDHTTIQVMATTSAEAQYIAFKKIPEHFDPDYKVEIYSIGELFG